MYEGTITGTGTRTYEVMTACKYRLPCGYCELKKEICTADNPITINPTWKVYQAEISTVQTEKGKNHEENQKESPVL